MAATVIHVVDDDESFRTAIARLLRAAGYDVAVYESAQLLLERLPDDGVAGCVLLDVQIPGLSGPELQTRLAALGSALPIVFLTGHADNHPLVVAAKRKGDAEVVSKPIDPDCLQSVIDG